MNLYAIHQPDSDSCDFGHEYWDYIWAVTPQIALLHYADRWKGECDPHATTLDFVLGCSCEVKETLWKPTKEGAHFECRMEVLRDLGCHCDGEDACESCGLYPMDMEEHAVCPECLNCTECGHADDCEGWSADVLYNPDGREGCG